MPECFCGCGRRYGFLTLSRGINNQGRRTVELLDKMRAAREKLEREPPPVEGGDNGPQIEMLTKQIEEGEEYEDFWRDALHSDFLPPPDEARKVKRAWIEWGKTGKRVTGQWS
jgi:hypothetical protein